MFQCYVTPEELYSGRKALESWILPEESDALLRDASNAVANDLRSRGIDISRLMVPVMLAGTEAYEYVTKTANYDGAAVGGYNASRLVIECSAITSTDASFALQGSQDGTTWFSLRSVTGPESIAVAVTGPNQYTAKYFEKFKYYRLVLTTTDSVTFSAFIVDGSPDNLIVWKAIENALFLVLDEDTRAQEMYDAARVQYDRLLNQLVSDYDTDGDDAVDTVGARPRTILYR